MVYLQTVFEHFFQQETLLSNFQWLQRFRQHLMFIIITVDFLCTFCNSLHVDDLSCSYLNKLENAK